MRLVVHGASLGDVAGTRMRHAAVGLGLRGHRVTWLGPGAPAGAIESGAVRHARRLRERLGARGDIVLGGRASVLGAVAGGWLAGAGAIALAVGPGDARRENPLERWAIESLDGIRMAEAGSSGGDGDPDIAPLQRWSSEPPGEAPDATHPDTEILERACERLMARRRGHAPSAAAFLDRDGTLVVETGYLARAEDLTLLPATLAGLGRLREAGYRLVVISNQSGVGRGFFPAERVYEAMARLRCLLREGGVELDAVYFCPHRPEAGCDCRKPGTLLLREAAANLGIALERSVMVGDKLLDVETGHRARARGVLVRTGYGRDEEQRLDRATPAETPDLVADDLAEAAAWITAGGGSGEGMW